MYHNNKDRKKQKLLRKIITFVVTLAFVIPAISPGAFAETSILISGGDDVKGGDTFIVAVTFGSGSVGRVDAQMLYDTDRLTYVSGGSSSGNTGYIQLKNAGTEGSITFNIEFQALTEGDTTLEVTTNEMYDLDEMYLDTPSAVKTITITGNAEEEEVISETTVPEETVETAEMAGVDEKPTEENSEENDIRINLIFIFIAVVLVILIVIIAVILAARKKGNKEAKHEKEDSRSHDETGYRQMPRVGRSGKILDNQEYDRVPQQVIKKRSREETAIWDDWDLGDEGSDDIEKW